MTKSETGCFFLCSMPNMPNREERQKKRDRVRKKKKREPAEAHDGELEKLGQGGMGCPEEEKKRETRKKEDTI